MNALPKELGRTVYAEIDEAAGPDPLAQAAHWLARLEPWFGPCRSVGVLGRKVLEMQATVVSAGHDGDRAVLVHLAGPRPEGVGTRVRIEGDAATLQIEDGAMRLTRPGETLDPKGVALPQADAARTMILNDALAQALAHGRVEKIDG